MKENIFELTKEELQEIAVNLKKKIELGLKKDGTEILCIPTYINPKEEIEPGLVLALDWGGTHFRAAIVKLSKDKDPVIVETAKAELSASIVNPLTSKEALFAKMTELIAGLKTLNNQVTKIGYCFSYPAECQTDGDAKLLYWTKEIERPDMVGKLVGKMLMDYLNNDPSIPTTFTDIKVINDTVACLFAGLSDVGKDAYIGLIVGTGTNMAGLMQMNKIEKLNYKGRGLLPVNLESGNFNPPYLTVMDGLVDAMSNNKGRQRFEKAISGGYIGEIFKTVFCEEKIKYNFNGESLSTEMNNPQDFPEEHVKVATWLFDRSAKLVAASLAGLINVMLEHDATIKTVCLAADGSLFWKSSDRYHQLVLDQLHQLLPDGLVVTLADEEKMSEANLIGSAIAAVS